VQKLNNYSYIFSPVMLRKEFVGVLFFHQKGAINCFSLRKPDYTVSNSWRIANNENNKIMLEIMWKSFSWHNLRYYFRFPCTDWTKWRKPSVSRSCVPTKIQARPFINTRRELSLLNFSYTQYDYLNHVACTVLLFAFIFYLAVKYDNPYIDNRE